MRIALKVPKALAIAACLIIACLGNKPHEGTTYLAIGASETAGYGVKAQDSYPSLVADACSAHLVVVAFPGEPSLQQVVPTTGASFASLFIDLNDFSVMGPDGAIANFMRISKALSTIRRRVLVLMPPLRSIPGAASFPDIVSERQREFYRKIRPLIKTFGYTAVWLRPPTSADLLLADLIHPSPAGHREIAAAVSNAFSCVRQHRLK